VKSVEEFGQVVMLICGWFLVSLWWLHALLDVSEGCGCAGLSAAWEKSQCPCT